MTEYKFEPDWTVPPGDTIKETLAERKQSISDLAKATNETIDYLTDVIEARSPITEELAIKLEGFFKVPAKFWLKRQDTYDSDTYRLFWERVRVKPNLFAHLTDDQIEAMQVIIAAGPPELSPEQVELNANVNFITDQLDEEFCKRFFPEVKD